MASAFNKNKMMWLNAVCADCEVSPIAFRVAYLIGDHLNVRLEQAWPSHKRLASKLCVTTKSVQRAVCKLEKRGWLAVNRGKGPYRSNRYRICWPPDHVRRKDNEQVLDGHFKPSERDHRVHQTYSDNLPKTFLGQRRKKSDFPDRGLYEQKIIRKYGAEVETLLDELNRVSPQDIDTLCEAEKQQTLTEDHLIAMRQRLMAARNR